MNSHHESTKPPLFAGLVITVVALIVTSIVSYSFYLGVQMNSRHAPLVDAAMEIKLEATIAHLWFEEVLSGDLNESMETVFEHLNQAEWYGRAMLEGGQNPEGTFIPLEDAELRREINDVLEKLATFRLLTQKRFSGNENAIDRAETNQRFHTTFNTFIDQADNVETKLKQFMARDSRYFRSLQIVLICSCFALALFIGILYYRFDRRRAEDYFAIRDTNAKLEKEIFEHKQAEIALRESEENLDITLNSIGDAVIATDTNSKITRMNPVAEELTGWKLEETIGQPLTTVFHIVNANSREEIENPLEKVFLEGKVIGLANHTVLIARNGVEYQIADSGAPIHDRDGTIVGAILVFSDVTERYEKNLKLHQSEARLRLIADTVEDVFWITDWSDHRTIFVSSAYEKIWGKNAQDLYNNPSDWADAIHQEDRQRAWETFVRMEEKDKYNEEYRIIRPDGQTRWIHDRGFPIRDEKGQVDQAVGIAQDITERKQAEEVVRESVERFRGIVKSTSNGVAVYEAVDDGDDFKFLDFNPAAEKIENTSRGDVIGKRVTEVFPGVEEFGLLDVFRRVWKTGQAENHPVTLYKDERITSWRKNYVYRLSKGEIVAVYSDITEQKQAEETVRSSREFLQTIIDSMPEAVMVINQDYSIALANRTIQEESGEEDIADNRLTCHWVSHHRETPCQGDEHSCPLEMVFKDKASVTVEHTHYDDAGSEIIVEIVLAPIFDKKGEVVQIIESARNVTERKHLEKERLSLERQVQHAQKLESLGVLAGGIAHDFNNLLMAILGNADLALQTLSPHATARNNVQEIETASRRAADLAKQMLAYSGKGQFVIEAIDLNEFIKEMIHLIEISISKTAVLKFNYANNLTSIEGDATQIRQIILNLITNASEAISDKSGVIAVSTGAMDCDRTYLNTANMAYQSGRDTPLPEGLYVYIEVADTGCGMDRETIEKVFDPFFTTKFTGRGLGMAAVSGIVRGHKGAIKIYSEVDKGTTFKILFPASEIPAVSTDKDRVEEDDEWCGSGTVLIADDEETVRSVGKQMLELFGFNVLTASDGREAVDVFRKRADEITLVILDLTMPHLDGEQAFREIRRIQSDVKVLLSSGYNEQDATQRFTGKGLAGFLQKPYSVDSLKRKLREVLSQ